MGPTLPLLESDSNSTSFVFESLEWAAQAAYRCHVCLIPEDDGTWSAIVLNLPGAGSCGMTEETALENVKEAILGVIESYEMDGQAVPWQDSEMDDVPDGAKLIWILVNAR